MTDLAGTMFTTPEMSAIFSGSAFVQRMLDVEAALARAHARAGVIPQQDAEAIVSKCRVDLFDVAALYHEAAASGSPAIPLVRMLGELVGGDARKFVHWGATSQDVIDTAVVLQIREGLDLLFDRLLETATACATLAERHRRTPMAGRTLLQHAVPITFGLKAARWLSLVTRLVVSLRELRQRALVVQFGGAAGTLAALGADGVRVMEFLATEVDLAVPDLPWHTERDRIAEVATRLGIVAGGMGKVATDVALLSQTEVGEAASGATSAMGGSSTMPHKRNPVEATAAIACAQLAIGVVPTVLSSMIQEHERGAGHWQAEWQAIPELFRTTAGSVEWVYRVLSNLEIDSDRMRVNLDLTQGLVMAEALTMALAAKLGRQQAYRIVQLASERAVQETKNLREVADADPLIRAVLSPDEISRAFDVTAYLGSADAFIDRALSAFRALRPPTSAR
ncbi:MAG TPA: 3-carboxy-cis,cis-muconate cycloisomerase [bacterium]|nr:3-carboxy-cis,cis-muconate cycloisomerase [bacterium]